MSPVTLWPGFRSAIMAVSQFQATQCGVKKSNRNLIIVLFVDADEDVSCWLLSNNEA